MQSQWCLTQLICLSFQKIEQNVAQKIKGSPRYDSERSNMN